MILLTMHSQAYSDLADVTLPSKTTYCLRHGISLIVREHQEPVSCWQRPEAWLESLRSLPLNDWMLFMGTDAMITNPDYDVRQLCFHDADFVFCADGNGLQCDVWLMRSCPDTINYMTRVLRHQEEITSNEQDALSVELSGCRNYTEFIIQLGDLKQGGEPPSLSLLNRLQGALNQTSVRAVIVPQRLLNAYPIALYGGTGEEPHSWHPGDFIVHMPGKPNKERISFFKTLCTS